MNTPLPTESTSAPLAPEDLNWLVRRARTAVNAAVRRTGLPAWPEAAVPVRLRERRGCFVTLTESERLRGCIGNVLPRDPLHRMVIVNAQSAALHDSRFPPVSPGELDRLGVEVSVLTIPHPLTYGSPEELLGQLVPHEDGVLLHIGASAATFLPQVWAKIPDPVSFLNRLAEKAGCAPGDWRLPGTSVQVYRAQHAEEVGPESEARG